ncbi:MAG TPA: hypothetical protein VET23_13050, partial [Chitinophagaceae bacterium]|nr:hypothetical protein [Chitinophagaceae bacterium]
MEKQMVNQILETFTHLTGVKTKWIPVKANDYHYNRVEGAVQFILPDKKIEIATETKINIQYAHLPDFLNQQTVNEGLLVLAKYIMPKFKKRMQEMGVNYIDAAGNAFIKLTSLTVIIDGRKEVKTLPDLKAKPFSKTGLKVIFQILVHDDYINATFREIAKAADVSLDTVHKTINGLKELQYLVPLNNYTLKWNNKKELFDRWMTEYETRLKPGLHI